MWTTMRRLGPAGLLAGLLILLPARAQTPEDAAPPAGAEGEVQTRGPVHEAFAQPSELTPTPAPAVPKQAPEPINEVAPEQRPEGENVVWVPGYWAWDESRGDFLWVSGFWRAAPPDRKWVPGYWAEADGGWRWVSGFWADSRAEQMPYVAPPPESLERGPSVPPPGDDYTYVPGCWVPQEQEWAWRPGYWAEVQPNWVYCPPRYCWTPAGTVFVNGYWDYPLEQRGLLFAPVWFGRPYWHRPGWFYRPHCALNIASILTSLWIRPRFGHYAFGDYYDARYGRLGYRPWATHGGRLHDPLYRHYRATRRSWHNRLVDTHLDRVRNPAVRPPRTFAAQRNVASNLRIAQPLSSFRSDALRLRRTTPVDRTAVTKVASNYRSATTVRQRIETSRAPARGVTRSLPLTRISTPAGPKPRAGNRPPAAPRAAIPGSTAPRVTAPTTRPGTPRATTPPAPRPGASRPGSAAPPRPTTPPRATTPPTPRPGTPRTTPAPRPTPPRVTTPPRPSTPPRATTPPARPTTPPRATPRPTTPPPPTPRATRPPSPRPNNPAPRPGTSAPPRPRATPSTPRPSPRAAPPRPQPPRAAPPQPRAAPRTTLPRPAPRATPPRPQPAPRTTAPRPASRATPPRPAPRATPRPAPRATPPRPAPRATPPRPQPSKPAPAPKRPGGRTAFHAPSGPPAASIRL